MSFQVKIDAAGEIHVFPTELREHRLSNTGEMPQILSLAFLHRRCAWGLMDAGHAIEVEPEAAQSRTIAVLDGKI